MAAPSRLGNLTFSYHKETNGSLKKLRKPRTSDFLNDRNNKTLASSSFIFDKRKQKTGDNRDKYTNYEPSNRDKVQDSKTEAEQFIQDVESAGQYHPTKDEFHSKQYSSNPSTGPYMNKASDLYEQDQNGTIPPDNRDEIYNSDVVDGSTLDPFENLLENSPETKFYPDGNNNLCGEDEIESPQNGYENDLVTNVLSREVEETKNTLPEEGHATNNINTPDSFVTENTIFEERSSYERSSNITDSFSQGRGSENMISSEKLHYTESINDRLNISKGNITASRSYRSNGSKDVQRNVSFSVPDENHGPVAKVTRSNSKRLINDDNNLKSLFTLARSNENLNNLSDDDCYSKQEHAVEVSKRQRVVEEFSSQKMNVLQQNNSSLRKLPENESYKEREDLNSKIGQHHGKVTASNNHFDQVDMKPRLNSQYKARSNSFRQSEPPPVSKSSERPSSRVSFQSDTSIDNQNQSNISKIGNIVNRTQSLTSKDISSLMSYDGENTEAGHHPVQRQSPQVKPKRILPSTNTRRMLPKPDWNFNSQSFRTSNSRIEDNPTRIKKSQSFEGEPTDLDGKSIQNIGDALLSSDELESIHSTNVDNVSSNDQYQEKDDSTLKPRDFKKGNIKISRSPGFKSHSFSVARPETKQESRPIDNTALSKMGVHLISSDSDTTRSSQPQKESNQQSFETNQWAVSPAHSFVRNRSRSFDELLSGTPQVKHLEYTESTRENSAKTTSKYNSMNINYVAVKENDVEIMQNDSSPVNSISFRFSSSPSYDEKKKGRNESIKLNENFASLSLKQEESRNSKHQRSVLLSPQEQNSEDAKTRRSFQLSPQEQDVGDTKKEVSSTNTHGVINDHIDAVNQRLKQNSRWTDNPKTTSKTGHTHYKQSKKRAVNRKKNQHKRVTMEYGEYGHVMMKDNDSEGRASIDDGYETSRTYGSDLTNSTASELYQSTSNGLNLEHSTPSTNQKPSSSISTNHKVQSLSNLHEILNLECEDERKKQHEEEQRIHVATEAQEDLEQGRKGIHQKLDNMLKARVKTMNASDRSFTKRQTKFPDPLLLANEPPLIIDKEPSLRLEESIESLSRQQQSSDSSISYTSNQQSIGNQQAGSQPYSQHTQTVELPYTQQTVTEFSQNVNRPERSHSLNQKPPVMEYLSNQQPIDMNFQTNQQPSFNGNHQRNVPGSHQSMLSGNLHQNLNSSFNYTQPPTHEGYQQMSTTFSGNHQSMVPGNHQSMVPGNHQSMLPGNHHDNPHMNFNQNQQPTNEIPDDLYAKPDKANRHSEYTTSNQQQPRKIDVSYNTPSSSNYVSRTSSFHSTAPLMEKKLFHLRDKDTSELNKKESMLSELKLAMFKRSRPASPEVEETDHQPYPVIKEDYGNTPQHDYRQENNYGNSSVNHELYQQNSQSSYGTNMSNAGQIDLYNSFPLPTHKQNEELANGFQAYTNQSESEEKLTDENPIDKNQVMMMLKSHIKDKTGLSSLTRNNKDINFSRPKISSQTFSLISKDVDSEMVQNESRKLEPDFSDQTLTPEILVTEFRSPEVQRSRGLTINHSDEFETVNVRNRASTFTEAQPETDTNTQAIPPMDEVDSSPKNNSHVSRTDSFQSPYSIKYTQDGSSSPEEKPNFVSHAPDTSVSRNESFSSISVEPPQSRSISRVESMRSLKDEASLSRNTSFSTADVIQSRSRSSSFKSQIDETPIRRDRSYTNGSIADLPESIADVYRSHAEGSILDRNDSFSSMRVEYPESRSVSRIHSFSSTEYQPRSRSNTVLDSAIRYEKTKQIVEEPLDLSLDLDSVDRDTADRDTAAVISNRTHEPLIAPDSRGLNLRQTEYYLPEENEEKVIKPSEYKTHRFNDRNRSPKIEVGTESQPTTGRIQLVTDGTVESKRISNERISSNRSVPSVIENERKLSLTELKKKRQKERLMKSKRLSSSEPLLDKVGSPEFADNIQTMTQHTPRLSNNVRVTDTVSRKKKVEKYSSEIYTNTNVGRINIPDSFQQNKDSEWMIDEHEKRSDERFNERKHKREKAASNSSTPRASTPKKSKRRFSLTNMVSGGSTPRSARTDVTEFSNMSTSPRSMPATRPNSRPSSPSLGKRIKNIFSPRSKRKNKKNDSLDDSQDEIVDDDIIRRLNMNVSSNNNGTVTASSLGSLVTSGYSSIRSESGLSMTVANDEDFGIDDSFLSHQEWLNSHGGKVTVTKRPSIKQAIVPFNSSRNAQNNGSWKVRKNIGKVTVPEVFSSSRKIPDRQNGDAEFPYNSKFRNLRSSPAMTRKSKSKKSGLQAHDDVVFTSFDVAE